jgi:DNA-binding CsgD family transcriptional regulator
VSVTQAPPETDPLGRTLARLAEIGPPSEMLSRAPAEAAAALDLDRVLLSRIDDRLLVPESLHPSEGDGGILQALADAAIVLDYPLIEGDVLRRRRPQLVRGGDIKSPGRPSPADVMGWEEYAVAPILLDGRVIGLLHGDRRESGRSLTDEDAARLGTFALCFAIVFERSILRQRLRVQRQQMRQVASWADGRTSELSDSAITLTREGDDGARGTGPEMQPAEEHLRDLMTRRELQVLQLMVKGETNAGIARDLVVTQGTVKFHVKNILRKLHASNRAEATSRYMRITLGRDGRASL